MEIYRAERAAALQAFLLADAQTPGPWAHICASLPLYTFEPDVLQAFLAKRALAPRERLRHRSWTMLRPRGC